MRALLLILMLFGCSATLAAEWTDYRNARFGFSAAVPPGFAGLGESANGDGQVFRSARGTEELRVWGGFIVAEGFEAAMQAALRHAGEDGWRLSQQQVTPGWASYRGNRNGIVLYARTIALCDGQQFAAVSLEYAERDTAAMAPLIEKIAASLTAPRADC